MNKTEKIDALIEHEHPFEQTVAEITEGIKRDFFKLEEEAISKVTQQRAIGEIDDSLRRLKGMRHQRLYVIYDKFDEAEIDALLLLHASAAKLKAAMVAAHELKWEWVNSAKELSPTMNSIIVDAGVNWMAVNTEPDSQPLEDLQNDDKKYLTAEQILEFGSNQIADLNK